VNAFPALTAEVSPLKLETLNAMSRHFEQQFASLSLRSCHTVGEFRQALQLQKDIWNWTDIELVPVRLFVVAEKIGGHVLGAFAGKDMVGFAYGIPGVRGKHPYLHSHMLGVREDHRNTGLGRALKMFQREIALLQGFDLIEWTFDPLEIKNAYLNIEKLGAIARRYTVNQYGITTSPLQGGLPTDRLIAEWWIRSGRMQATLDTGHHPAIDVTESIDVPKEIYEWKATPEFKPKAAEVQARNRDKFQSAFSRGLGVLGYERDAEGNGKFLLGLWDEELNYPEQ
jgi:predicted GNAT superfamily acetyltransferase